MENLTFGNRIMELRRFPLREKESLRPWDAADEHILKTLLEEPAPEDCRLLIINDNFGALAVALNHLHPQVWSDSFLAREGLAHNLDLNGFDPDSVPFVPSDRLPAGPFDLVLMKMPKSMAYWEDTLLRLRPLLSQGARIITGGMIKHSPARALELLETVSGPANTGLGWKKSRLAFSTFDPELSLPASLPDFSYTLDDGLELSNGPNVFSRDHLDVGTRFLLKNLPQNDEPLQVLDIGSGNGVLALALARQCPEAFVLGVDESYQAVASGRANASALGFGEDRVKFQVEGGLQNLPAGSFDLAICNPPFHQAQVVGDQIAWGMFHQSRRILKKGGKLLIVGNRHLGYHVKLQRLFGNCRVVASDRKFVVLESWLAGLVG